MEGKIIIYGGSGGIGSQIAKLLSAQGHPLHLVARDRDRLSAAAEEVNAGYTVGDVRDADLFTQVMKETGSSCSGLVYAVGTINTGSLRRLSASDYLEDFKVNALGAVLAAKAALPLMKKSSTLPSMVFFSSVAALQGFTFHSSISMAKAAINGLVLALAAELAPRIRVNGIAPSITDTPLSSGILKNEELARKIASSHALNRVGKAIDVAKLAVFLVTDESSWITGQIFNVDGGRSTLRTAGA